MVFFSCKGGIKLDSLEKIADDLNTHLWKPEKERTALLLIDLQEYFRALINPILKNILKVLEKARDEQIPVFFTQHGHKKDEPPGMIEKWWSEIILYGTREHALLPELKVSEKDSIIPKNRYNAFHGTGLEEKLKSQKITDVVMGGVMTNLCCETTARDAFVRNFRVFFLADGTQTASQDLHLASLKNLAFGFATLMTCEQAAKSLV